MKANIYFFSGTGNSLAIAKDLANELSEASYEAETIPIASLIKETTININADTVGIVFPVYCSDMPSIVREFASKLVLNDAYIFAVATAGNSAGNSLFNLNEILEQKGSTISAGFLIVMPGNSVIVYDLTTSKKGQEKRLSKAKSRVKQIAGIVKNKVPHGIEGKFNKNEKYATKKFLEDYGVVKHFWTTDSCNSCGTCVKTCPKSNIEIINDKVVWGDKCEYCLACLHWCPLEAIQNGKESVKYRRYHHPDIKVEEIMAQNEIK